MQRPRILLAPGASGTIERLRDHERGLTARGMEVHLVDLPRGRVERAVPVYRQALEGFGGETPIIGGHSFGGRVASLLAPELPPAALVLLSYPLHAPGRQPSWQERTSHWPRIACPVLVLSGESDPFADLTLLRQAVQQLPDATLFSYAGVGHGLGPVLDDALDRIADFATRQR
ncbi:MAG: dienelactone hydrolase family protein [Chloroflexota bacterium]|nr:dienelactone hydrolase family protein [Chloroflexota bacterium]